jgi:imidazolonepropionase-like amidohydrolase
MDPRPTGGATLLPGLIDAHTHPEGPAALQESLRFGVTTVLGMGVTTTANEEALRAAAARRPDVADYRSAGTPATAPDGIPNLSEDTVRALVRAAHARAMLVVAHVESLGDVRAALAGGVDGLAHLWRENGPADEIVTRIASQRMFVVPTIATVPAHPSLTRSSRRCQRR